MLEAQPLVTHLCHWSVLRARHDGRYIVQGVKPTCIEGDWRPQRMVIIEFPERSKAEAFLSDPIIQGLFKVRHETTTSKLVLVDGCT
jgi:uncharacterized protein (DUF1330 family)